MKPIIWWSVLIAFGLVMFVSFAMGPQKPSGDVYCGSHEVMQPGDLCEETHSGDKHVYTYDEKKQQDADDSVVSHWATLVMGCLFTPLGTFGLVRAIRRRRARGSAPAAIVPGMATPPQQWAQPTAAPYQQQPQYQSQPRPQYPQPQYPQPYPQQPYQQQYAQPPQNFGPQGH